MNSKLYTCNSFYIRCLMLNLYYIRLSYRPWCIFNETDFHISIEHISILNNFFAQRIWFDTFTWSRNIKRHILNYILLKWKCMHNSSIFNLQIGNQFWYDRQIYYGRSWYIILISVVEESNFRINKDQKMWTNKEQIGTHF